MVKKCADCGKLMVVDNYQRRFCDDCRVIRKNYTGIGGRRCRPKKVKDAPIPEHKLKYHYSPKLGISYGIYMAIMEGYLPGKEDLLRRERELRDKEQSAQGSGRREGNSKDPEGSRI